MSEAKPHGRSIYLTAAEESVLSLVLDLARGCGELDDIPDEYKQGVDMKRLLTKFRIDS